MRFFYITGLSLLACQALYGQTNKPTQQNSGDNIYTIKQQFLYNVLHNPEDKEGEDDNELARFNRWFHDAEVRSWPSGYLPRPDAILTATLEADKLRKKSAAKTTSTVGPWQPVGPMTIPLNNNGIGRVNCIVIDPLDTGKLYIGTACGGVFVSHDGGNTWTSHTDNFPSLSIADIAVNPIHTDTIYAATGDGYGYEGGFYDIFWGGLYSAGVMMSTDGGNTWNTTGLSYLQSDRDIIQRLLIHPTHPNILLAASRNGIYRTTDAGASWTNVDAGHVYSMAFKPGGPDTIYAINNSDLRVSYNAGATWSTLHAGLNPSADRATIAVSPAAPNNIWVLDADNKVQVSSNKGASFYPTIVPPDTAHFYGYYDRVLAVSPTDKNYILAFGSNMGVSTNGGASWAYLNQYMDVHVDNHAVAINPLAPTTIFSGNDGGISVTYDGGIRWKNLANGLMISQIYRMSSSQQSPYLMLCGLQDNGSLHYDSVSWLHVVGGDGEACAISPVNDGIQVASWQNGHFQLSADRGASFSAISVSSETGAWTSPVVFDPVNSTTIYFGLQNIYVTYDGGGSFANLTGTSPFSGGATTLAVAPSNSNVIYAGDLGKLLCSTNGGATWTNVTGNLPVTFVALTAIAVDPRDPMHVYAVMSGYVSGYKVYVSTTGGNTWSNMSMDMPNVPMDCIAVDSTTPGALFVGTDMGIFYTDSSQTGWTPYSTGLPNVIVNDLNINYGNYKVRAATYGRGIWECNLKKQKPSGVPQVAAERGNSAHLYPNPASDNWHIMFDNSRPPSFTVNLTDVTGRLISTCSNTDVVDASELASGIYNVEITAGEKHYSLKAVKK